MLSEIFLALTPATSVNNERVLPIHEISLDTSAYLLPCDNIVNIGKHQKKLVDKKAMLRIRQLAQEGLVKLFISANVHVEIRKHRDTAKRARAEEFWAQVKPELIPQEIGFEGVHRTVGGSSAYVVAIDRQEAELASLKDRSPDSSIILNSRFFGMTVITADYKRIKKIKQQLSGTVKVLRPSEFIAKIDKKT